MSSPSCYGSANASAHRPMKVIVVGAGISGIITAIKLQESIQNLQLSIYDKNPEVGGTWWENRYPGCACDIPAHTYQLSFESNAAWSTYYAAAKEILNYWKRIAEKYNLRKYMNFRHHLTHAEWNQSRGKWTVTFENQVTGTPVKQECDILITAMGVLNNWDWPKIPGLHDFKGKLMHSADWDESQDLKGKRVAVIGAGSSGIQIVPTLQPEVTRIDHYVRGRTWIASPFGSEEVTKRGGEAGNFHYSDSEIEGWQKDPASYMRYRKDLENVIQGGYEVTARGSKVHEGARAAFEKLMADRVKPRPEYYQKLVPDFAPFCRRLTPGPGYLESLMKDNVDTVFDGIERVSPTGILGKDGKHREVDVIVCATGFNTSYHNRFPIYGRDGQKLFERTDEKFRLSTYVSLATDGFPNLFMMLGPNAGVGHGNLLIILESLASYCVQAVAKLQRENLVSMEPKSAAVDSFTNFSHDFFQKRVFSDECSTWYKADGRVTALWPGSSLHAVETLAHPRWEDYQYTHFNNNPMSWIGDGTTTADNEPSADRSYYLKSLAQIHNDL